MQKGSKIFVAGHRGLVGSAILRKLLKQGYSNIVTKARGELDLRRQEDAEKFFEVEQPEYVFFAAATVGGILANSTYKARFIYDNLVLATNVIHSAYKYGAKKLLNLASSCIYPRASMQPIKEEYLLTGALEPTNEPYAIAKIAALKLCKYYNEQYKTNFISAMPASIYGPHDNFNLQTAHLPPALLRKFYLARLMQSQDYDEIRRDAKRYPLGFGVHEDEFNNGNESVRHALSRIGVSEDCVVVWGSGEPFREFLYVDDLADACVFLMEKYDCSDLGEFINIGTGSEIKINDLADMVRETVDFKGKIKNDTSKPDGMPKKLLETVRLEALGWEPKMSLREGLRLTYQWYVDGGIAADRG